jgi:pyrroloquinoline quinone biosynthesis protein D
MATNAVVDAENVPQKTPEVDFSKVGAEFVVLDAEGRVLRGLNPTGARIWELIDGRRSLAQIAGCVAVEFRVTSERALQDVIPFVEQLASKKLLVLETGAQR